MNKIEQAIQYYHEGNFSQAENYALEIFVENNESFEALDILAAIYLKENKLDFLNNLDKKHLTLIRKLAGFLAELKTYKQAAFFYEKAVELVPEDIVGLNNLGLLYEETELNQKAKKSYEKSIHIKENYPALYNLGVLARKEKNLSLSKTYLQKALNIEPDNPYANYSLGMTYFMEKDFEKGYPYFLKRPIKNADGLRNFWDGSNQKDKTILVFCEYGLGDAIMFARYFPMLKNYFAKIIVCCNPSLHTIFKNSFPDIEFVSEKNVSYDFCVFSMDLPYYLKIDFGNIPYSEGYLKVNEDKVMQYKKNYFNTNEKKIGIFYIGGELQKRNAKYRSIPLANLSKLFSTPNRKFYSLQKEDVFNELKDFPDIINLGETFSDFADTAAAMKNLDLIITIDSAPVHLAGALGIKTFLMLPYYSEWRWFSDERKTPWYNSVNLFRQTTPCDWQSVVDCIFKEI